MEPLVSIITPCYNGEKYLDRYFESILGQTYSNMEIIFVNDGSVDRTEMKVLEYQKKLEASGRRFIYLKQKNAGQAAALNNGLKAVSGEFMIWPDADDAMPEESVSQRVSYLMEHPEKDYCVSDALAVSDLKKEIKKPHHSDSNEETFMNMLRGKGYIMCGAYMLRTSFLDRIIKGREIYTGRGGQNFQILLPAVYFGNGGYIDRPLYYYYIHEDSHSHASLADSPKRIEQLEMEEKIVVETLLRMDYPSASDIAEVKARYARLRFGHALDTKNSRIIHECAHQLRKLGCLTLHDRYLIVRYTNALINKIRPVS